MRLEGRKFGSKKQLLVIAETPAECKLIYAALGQKQPSRFTGEVVYDGEELYLRLQPREK